MNQEHHFWDWKRYFRGADTSTEKEITGAQENSGVYIILRNGRPTSTDGDTGDANKIRGEQLLYQKTVAGNYTCTGTISVNSRVIEFWASPTPGEFSFVRIDGVVVLQSSLFDIRVTHPLQLDKNENCIGGEVFLTDFRIPPMIFNVQDMIDSLVSDPNKYFSNFDPLLYSVNLSSPLDIPVFVELVNVGGGGGLPVGEYQYQMRYASKEGDRTNFSAPTPLIPVVQNLSSSSDQYPFIKTYGASPDPNSKTRYAIKLRFRVTNLFNYDFIEITRLAHNSGAGIGFTPTAKVVAKIDIVNQEISVREFLDPVESNTDISLSDEETTREIAYVEAAKTIRYFDKRTVLMNVKLASKESALVFDQYNQKTAFPVIDNLGKAGYNDPWNHAYKKKYMAGERYGFAVQLFDGVGGKGFATKVPGFENYKFPNRRITTDPDTDLFSYLGNVKAASIANSITQTHEVFDLSNAIAKTDKCSFKNIYRRENLGLSGQKSKAIVTEDCDETNGEIENHGATVTILNDVYPYWHPYTPVRQNDPDVTGHNYVVNTQVSPDDQESNGVDYRPPGFAPNYYSMGLALAGVSNFPAWAKAFSVVRTEAAKRVVAQGIGMYYMIPAIYTALGNTKLTTKEKRKFWFFSPDIENGVVASDVVNDIIDAPENYKIQFVSPLGHFGELYNFENNTISENRSRLIDMVSYTRMIRDAVGGALNPTEDPNMGFPGGDGFNYVGYGKWRNQQQQPTAFAGGDLGDNLFDIATVERIAEGRGTYMGIEITTDFYGTASTGGSSDDNFEDDGMKNFTEPFYMVNIVADGAIVRDQNMEQYRSIGHYQKLESIIGQGNGNANQKFILVDERWEDCIPALSSTHPNANIDRYLYIKRATTNVVEKWMNVAFKTPAQLATIVSDIANNGFFGPNVVGIYTHTNVNNQSRFFEIDFPYPNFYPQQDDKILVRYDNTAPIRCFGGDTVVGEAIFAPIDREADAHDDASDTMFAMGIGFPYRHMKLNPRHYVIKRTTGIDRIQNESWSFLGYIRQLCVMFCCESRIHLPYSFNSAYPLQFFPLINYVMRPNRWDIDKTIEEQNIYKDYVTAYGEDEKTQWKWGGFRFLQQVNPDYSNESAKEYVSRPEFGFTEKTEFCTRIMWSLPRAINVQDAPGLRTFPANNAFDIDDDQGEIKRAWEATSSRGENLYAFCNTGICLLVTKKSILSDLDAGELAYMAADTFVKQQYWLNKNTGMFDEMWRSAAEGFVPVTPEGSPEVLVEALFFSNDKSSFRFMDNQLYDIGRTKFFNTINPALETVQPGYLTKVTGVYDEFNQEYWLHIDDCGGAGADPNCFKNTFVFGQKLGMWHGTNDYGFDKFLSMDDRMFGMRDEETFELGKGFIINGQPVVFEATHASAMQPQADKEFIRIRINTGNNVKPTRVEFYDEYNGTLLCFKDPSQGPLYLKNYRGFEGFIDRKLASVSLTRDRVQGRLLVYKIIHSFASPFKLISTGVQYKLIK